MSTELNFGRDVQGYNAFAPYTAKDKWSVSLTTATETNITVPSNFKTWIAFFSYEPGAIVWVDLTGATATPPAGATLAACTAELNPGQRELAAGAKISCYNSSASTQDIGIVLYAIS